jgi:hypothetical protein
MGIVDKYDAMFYLYMYRCSLAKSCTVEGHIINTNG